MRWMDGRTGPEMEMVWVTVGRGRGLGQGDPERPTTPGDAGGPSCP